MIFYTLRDFTLSELASGNELAMRVFIGDRVCKTCGHQSSATGSPSSGNCDVVYHSGLTIDQLIDRHHERVRRIVTEAQMKLSIYQNGINRQFQQRQLINRGIISKFKQRKEEVTL